MKPNFESIKESFKENANKIGVTAGVLSSVVGPLNSEGSESHFQDKKVDPVFEQAEPVRDVRKDEGNFVIGDQKGNENKEKLANIKFAKEALLHIGKGAYLSDLMPGVILISEKGNPGHNGSLSYYNSIITKSYPLSINPVVGQYKIYNMAYDTEIPGEGAAFKFSERDLSDKPLDASFTHSVLVSNGLSVIDAYKILNQANNEVTVESLSKLIISSEFITNENERLTALENIKILESIIPESSSSDTQNMTATIK